MIIRGETGGIITSFECLMFSQIRRPFTNLIFQALLLSELCKYFIAFHRFYHFQLSIQMLTFVYKWELFDSKIAFPNQGYIWNSNENISKPRVCLNSNENISKPGVCLNSNENISKPRVCLNSNENISKPRVWLNSNENISKPRVCLKITIWWNRELIQSNSQCFGHFHNVDYNSNILTFVILN